MKKIVLLVFVSITNTICSAQKIKFGKISKEELEEKVYPLDSTADAAYLYKYRKTFFSHNYSIITEIHERIKIYTKEGFENATQKINFYSKDEKVSGLKGITYNLVNGKIQKINLSKEEIFTDKKSKNWSQKKFSFPSIKEGCIIDLRYKVTSNSWGIDDLEFQYNIPIKKLKYITKTTEYIIYDKQSKGYFFITPKMKTDVNGPNNERINVSTYEAENIPSLKDDEPYVDNINNYRGGIKYELAATNLPNSYYKSYSKTWNDVAKKIHKFSDFGGELKKTSYFKNDLELLLDNAKSPNERINEIFEFVKSKVKWNDYYGKYTDQGVVKAYKTGTGNVAEINLMLVSMLREAGLNAYPVLISTKGHGIPIFPTMKGFNYVIASVKINDDFILLDATEKYNPIGMLPARAINWRGKLITKEGAIKDIDLTPKYYASEANILNIDYDSNFNAKGIMRSSFKKLFALHYRNKYNDLSEDKHISKLEDNYKIEIDKFKVSYKDNITKPISHNLSFEGDDFTEEINGKVYIDPLLFLKTKENPFKSEERKFPIDMVSPIKEINKVRIKIPENYTIESIPESIKIEMSDGIGSFNYSIKSTGNYIDVQSILKFNVGFIVPSYYKEIKKFYKIMVEKQAEKIILIKK